MIRTTAISCATSKKGAAFSRVCSVQPQSIIGPGKRVGFLRVSMAIAAASSASSSLTILPSTNPSPSSGRRIPITAAAGGRSPSGPGTTRYAGSVVDFITTPYVLIKIWDLKRPYELRWEYLLDFFHHIPATEVLSIQKKDKTDRFCSGIAPPSRAGKIISSLVFFGPIRTAAS